MLTNVDDRLAKTARRRARQIQMNRHKNNSVTEMIAIGFIAGFKYSATPRPATRPRNGK